MDTITLDTSDKKYVRPLLTPQKKIWAIGGGKGGVGKSLIAANLGVTLARKGSRVILVDLDLGGANLHTCLGVGMPRRTLGDFLERRVENIGDLVVETKIKRLGLISGAKDSLWVANLKHAQKRRFISKLLDLDADYIIVDLGAGTTFNTLDFFISADLCIVALVPEPTSIENVYRFIKSAFYRKLRHLAVSSHLKEMMDELMRKQKELNIKTPLDLINELKTLDPVVGYEYG